MRQAQSIGYFSRLFFVGTSNPCINAEGVARRVMQGGHDVPIPKIIARYYRSIANCALIGREVNRLYLYDNSIDGEEAKLILRIADGKMIKQYAQIPKWAEPVVEAL